MDEQTKSELKQEIIKELRTDYYMVGKDDWRAYFVRTTAALILVGGVTVVAVLAVIWSGTGAATRAYLEDTVTDAREIRNELAETRDDWSSGDVTISGLTVEGSIELRGDDNGLILTRGDQTAVIKSNGFTLLREDRKLVSVYVAEDSGVLSFYGTTNEGKALITLDGRGRLYGEDAGDGRKGLLQVGN